jgi:hypothetical protein
LFVLAGNIVCFKILSIIYCQHCFDFVTGAGKGDTITTETDLEASSTSKNALCKNRYSTLFGIDLSPDTVAVAMVYFVQGVLGLARLAVSFYLKDDLHLDPAEVSILKTRGCSCDLHIF